MIQTEESYRRGQPDLVKVRALARPGRRTDNLGEIARLSERVEFEMSDGIGPIIEKRKVKAEESGALLDVFNHQRLVLYALPLARVPEQARYFLNFLKSVRFNEDPDQGPFPNPGIHLVEVNRLLIHRLKIASVWLRIEQDSKLSNGDLSHILDSHGEHEKAFESSSGLYSGVMMFDAYISPLLAAGSPGIWALSVIRSFGSLIFDFGTFISGTEGDAAEMLQLITIPGADEVVEFPKFSASAAGSAIRWWAERLNLLFGVLSDLSTFTDATGDYRPAKHLEALLTVEQVFRRTASLLLAHRDTNARRTLLFTILDSLEGIRGTNLLTMCKLGHAEKVLASLEASVPSDAAEILLPAARRGVEALRTMQNGFFIQRQLGTVTVNLQLDRDVVRPLPLEDAAARYLKILRDATHGHGADKESARAMTDALLAHHDGEIPHDIGLLGYLYLLDVLAQPSRTRRLLYRGGR